MSPRKFQETDQATAKGTINGPRPATLRINKDSYNIHKQSSSQSQSVIDNSCPARPPAAAMAAKRPPVIIYTHSPKIIHAQARDFMALVQKLTGLSRSEDDKTVKSEESVEMKNGAFEEENSSVMRDDEKALGKVKQEHPSMLKGYNQYLVDDLYFSPNSGDLYCSSRPTINSLFQSPTMMNSVSPTFMELMNRFPE